MEPYHGGKKLLIREFDAERDSELVEKLERDLEIKSRRGFSILTNLMGDPLCRVRLYADHVMLVAELVGERGLVGVVRGCMKCVGTGLGAGHVRVGCILGLRVSPKHRRMGIGSTLVKSVEDWAAARGARYVFLAAEEDNVASINLFVRKCDYAKLSSLSIIVQPIDANASNDSSRDIKIEKLTIEQAVSLYKDRLGHNRLFPVDIDSILNARLSLGTWVSYFKEGEDFMSKTPRSWAMLSMWKTYESYNLQIKGAPLLRCFQMTLSHIGSKLLPCFKVFPSLELLCNASFGFVFVYGLHGEGEGVGDLMRSLWNFARGLGRTLSECKAIVTELGAYDPIMSHVPMVSSTSRIDDVWFVKRVGGDDDDDEDGENGLDMVQPLVHVFVDPRDF